MSVCSTASWSRLKPRFRMIDQTTLALPYLSQKFGDSLAVPMEPWPFVKLMDVHLPQALRVI